MFKKVCSLAGKGRILSGTKFLNKQRSSVSITHTFSCYRSIFTVTNKCNGCSAPIIEQRQRYTIPFIHSHPFSAIAAEQKCIDTVMSTKLMDTPDDRQNSDRRVEYCSNGYPSKRGPTSNVILKYDGANGEISDWEQISMLFGHESIRFYNQLLGDVLSNIDNNPSIFIANKDRIFEVLSTFLTNYYMPSFELHSDWEENHLFPFIKEKLDKETINQTRQRSVAPSASLINSRTLITHDNISMLVSQLIDSCNDIRIETDEEWLDMAMKELLVNMDILRSFVDDHFALEETQIPLLLKQIDMSYEQWYADLIVPTLGDRERWSIDLPLQMYCAHSWLGESHTNQFFITHFPQNMVEDYHNHWDNQWRSEALLPMMQLVSNNL